MNEKVVVEITRQDAVAVVAFKATSISNIEGIAAASKQIIEFIEENHPKKIVFDFERVKFFSSQVLGLLLHTRAKLKEYNGQVVISAIDPRLHKIFRITNLDKIFEFFPHIEGAVKAIIAD